MKNNPRYHTYVKSSLYFLALLALISIPIMAASYMEVHDETERTLIFYLRIGITLPFLFDYVMRLALTDSKAKWFLRNIPLLVAIGFPPLRLIYSIETFRIFMDRKEFYKFIMLALITITSGTITVWYFERAGGGDIYTWQDAWWWSIVTSTTVGYGDLVPVTTGGRIVAAALMAFAVVTLSMITARIAANFSERVTSQELEEQFTKIKKATVSTSTRIASEQFEKINKRFDELEEKLGIR